MTAAQKAKERGAKWLRYGARALAVCWALGVTFCWLFGFVVPSAFCGASFGETDPAYPLLGWLTAATVVLAPWIAAAIPWRWQRAGAVVVLFLCVLVPVAHLNLNVWAYPTWTVDPPMSWTCSSNYLVLWFVCMIPTVLPGLLAALLLLASWWKSRTPKGPEDTNRTQREEV
jgi:hypothetical protein